MKVTKICVIMIMSACLAGCGENNQKDVKDAEKASSLATTSIATTQEQEETGLYGNMRMVDPDGNTRINVYDLESAEVQEIQSDDGSIAYVVALNFTEEGAQKFAEVTIELIGSRLDIVVDDQVVSSPTVTCAITNGEAQIAGLDSYDEAYNLVMLIRGDKDNPATFDD